MVIVAAKRKTKRADHQRIGPQVFDSMNAYRAGEQDYYLFKPRPPTPTDETADNPESFKFYGWMIARARDVQKIIEDVRALGMSTKKADALVTKRTDALDRAHAPDGRKQMPIW